MRRWAALLSLLGVAAGCRTQSADLMRGRPTSPLVVEVARVPGEQPDAGAYVTARLVNAGRMPLSLMYSYPLFSVEVYRWREPSPAGDSLTPGGWERDPRTDAVLRPVLTTSHFDDVIGPGESRELCYLEYVRCIGARELIVLPFVLEQGTYRLDVYAVLGNGSPWRRLHVYGEPVVVEVP